MADGDEAAGVPGIEWVQAPTVEDGEVVYEYRNSGTGAGQFYESMTVIGSGAPAAAQLAEAELEPGATRRASAPLGHDLAEGVPFSAHVNVQATAGTAWDASLDGSVDGVVVGGVPRPAVPADPDADAEPLSVDIGDARIDGDDLVVTYRFVGGAKLEMVSMSVTLGRQGEHPHWSGITELESDREDIARVGVPVEAVDGDDWQIDAVLGGRSGETFASCRLLLNLERNGDAVEAGSWSVLTTE